MIDWENNDAIRLFLSPRGLLEKWFERQGTKCNPINYRGSPFRIREADQIDWASSSEERCLILKRFKNAVSSYKPCFKTPPDKEIPHAFSFDNYFLLYPSLD